MGKMITVIPAGGMANRLRCIRSAVSLAKHINSKLCIVWSNEPVVACNFCDVIESIEGVEYSVKNLFDGALRKNFFSADWWRHLAARVYKENYRFKKYGNVFIDIYKLSEDDIRKIAGGVQLLLVHAEIFMVIKAMKELNSAAVLPCWQRVLWKDMKTVLEYT